MSSLQTTFSDFSYDPKIKRYRVVRGIGSGQFISKEAFLENTRLFIKKASYDLENIASESLTLPNFQTKACKILKDIHIAQAILGANGIENMTTDRWLLVREELKRQFYKGSDEALFGIRLLARDIRDKGLSEAQIRYRLRLFATGSIKSFWDQQNFNNKDKVYAYRTLHANESCKECLYYASLGVQFKEKLPLPTQKCSCKANCKCRITYLDRKEYSKYLLGSLTKKV